MLLLYSLVGVSSLAVVAVDHFRWGTVRFCMGTVLYCCTSTVAYEYS